MKCRFLFIIAAVTQTTHLSANGFAHDLINPTAQSTSQPTLIRLDAQQPFQFNVTMADLVSHDQLSLRAQTPLLAQASGRHLVTRGDIQIPDLPDHIEKNIPNLWRVLLPPDWPVPEQPVSVILLQQHPLNPQLRPWVQRQSQLTDGTVVIEGGLTVMLTSGSITHAGNVELSISIDLITQ
jgi:hypothetical protein